MGVEHLEILTKKISDRLEERKDPFWQLKSDEDVRVRGAIRSIELGCVDGLSINLKELRDDHTFRQGSGDNEIIAAALTVLKNWEILEAKHGQGALLDYQHCLTCSPPNVVGISRIENAKRFQAAKFRVPDDQFWSLQFA